jgi:hypothetical protein
MKYLLSLCLLFTMASGVSALPAHYTGNISSNGVYSGSLDTNFGWINTPFAPNSTDQDLNLWGLNANAGEKLSLTLSSNELLTGFSLYFGEVDSLDLLFGLFNNEGDIGAAQFLTGSDPWSNDTTLSNFSLDFTGFYTLIVGGKDFGGYSGYGYDMTVSKVSEPAGMLILFSGLLGLAAQRRLMSRR